MSEEQRAPEVRASDAEREQAVERLRKASVEGRLTLEEVVERSEAAYAAKTHRELERLTLDLPAPMGGVDVKSKPPRSEETGREVEGPRDYSAMYPHERHAYRHARRCGHWSP